jgi:hypothetical protein
MLRVHRQQGSEQRRQHAPHVAEVLQNLSVKRSNATSCNSSRTPREGLRRGEGCGLRRPDADLDTASTTIRLQITQLGWATEHGPPKS